MDSVEDTDKPPPTNTEKQPETDVDDQDTGSQQQTPAPSRTSGRVRQKPKEWSPSGDEPSTSTVVLPRPKDSTPRPPSAKSVDSDLSGTPSNDIADTPPPTRVPRQRIIKRFSPSPPPSKKQASDRPPTVRRSLPKHIPPDTINLSDFKRAFFVNGFIPETEFKLDESFFPKDEDRQQVVGGDDNLQPPDRDGSEVRKSFGMPPVSRPKKPAPSRKSNVQPGEAGASPDVDAKPKNPPASRKSIVKPEEAANTADGDQKPKKPASSRKSKTNDDDAKQKKPAPSRKSNVKPGEPSTSTDSKEKPKTAPPSRKSSVKRGEPSTPTDDGAKPKKQAPSRKSNVKPGDVAGSADGRVTHVGVPSPSGSKPRIAAGADRSSKSSSRDLAAEEEFKVPLPSRRSAASTSLSRSPSREIRAESSPKEETDGTPSGRPARKAAAFIHQFVAQVQGKNIAQPSASKGLTADQPSPSTSESAAVESTNTRSSVAKEPPAEVPLPNTEEDQGTSVSKRKPKRKIDESLAHDEEDRDSSLSEPQAKVKKAGSEPMDEALRISDVATSETPKQPKRFDTRKAKIGAQPKNRSSVIPTVEQSSTDSAKSDKKERITSRRSVLKEQETESDKPSSSGTPGQDESHNIRRSGRQSAPSAKLLEMRERVAPPTPRTGGFIKLSVKPKPGSALEILKKTTQFRANRSPTPELTSALPSEVNTPEKNKEAAPEEEASETFEARNDIRLKEEIAVKEDPVQKAVEEHQDELVLEKTKQDTKDVGKGSEAVEQPTLDFEDDMDIWQDSPAEPDETPLSLSFVQSNEPTLADDTSFTVSVHSPTPGTSKQEVDKDANEEPPTESPVKIRGGKGPLLKMPAPLKKSGVAKPAPSKVTTVPKPTPSKKSDVKLPSKKTVVETPAPSRRSGRMSRPNKLFEDYVGLDPSFRSSETHLPESSRKTEVTKKAETGKKAIEQKKEVPAKKNEPKKQKKPEEPEVPAAVEETAAEKTRKHLNEHRPIKVLFKIGGEVSTSRVVGMIDEEPSEPTLPSEDEVVDSEELSVFGEELEDEEYTEASVGDGPPVAGPSKKKEKSSGKYPSWWSNYMPSPKPIIENCIRPDGTVEKIGVSVNAVMDKILLMVCDDGITRNSNKNSMRAKKEQLLENAKMRYYDKKEKERINAQFDHAPVKKTSSELYAHTISTRERTKKAGLYKQNEYLLKPVKQQKQLAEDKETQQRKALEYLSKQFQKEAQEDLRHSPKENVYKPKKVIKQVRRVTFPEFAEARGEKTMEMLLPTVKAPDTFHRELLRDEDENTMVDDEEDEVVDVMEGAEEPLPDPVGLEEDSITVANQIAALLMRPTNLDGSFDVSDLYMRIQEETPERRGAYDWAINEIVEFFVVQSSAVGDSGQILVHNEAMRHATVLYEAFSRVTQETSVWTHRFLIEYLPLRYLSSYLFLLRYLKFAASTSFTSLIIKASANDYHPWPKVTEIVKAYVAVKVDSPDKDELQTTLSEFHPDVIFVFVPPNLIYNGYNTIKDKSHDIIFRWIKACGDNKNSIVLDMDFDGDSRDSILDAVFEMTQYVKETILKLSQKHRDKRIVLVGFRMATYLNHRVLATTHGVSALIDLAFPLKTRFGSRGNVDDDFNLTYAPTLFVIGTDDPNFDPVIFAKMRQTMTCKTGAILIHHADENLYVNNYVLNKMGVTQRAVYRGIVEAIVDFLRLDVTRQERIKLIPLDINNIYDLDVDAMKAVASGPQQKPKPTAEQKAAQREATAAAKRKRKAEMYPPTGLVQLPPMPALHAEPPGHSLNEARSRFDDIVKQAIVSGPREAQQGVVKASPLPSPALPRELPQLLDPANISLN